MPFKDFKGNVNEAMTKLVKDLKIFGYSGWRTLKIESLKGGYGDQVCEVITELINLELYRRDFKFFPPVFPKDEEDLDNSKDDDNGMLSNSTSQDH